MPDAGFVGRESELARLRGARDDARGGYGSVATVVGEPGSGKTRLMRELERHALAQGALVLWGARVRRVAHHRTGRGNRRYGG